MIDETTQLVHELQAPLTVIKTRLEQALQAIKAPMERGLLEDCLEEVERMQRCVVDLLLLARPASPSPGRERVDLEPLLESIGEGYRDRAASRGIHLRVAAKGPLDVEAHPSALQRILCNLLDNALKFTPEQGKVAVTARASGAGVEVRVADTGPGIAPSAHALIFKPFYQVDKEAAEGRGGVGLGLSIARKLAETYEGTLEVESLPGKGSCFILTLPRAESTP